MRKDKSELLNKKIKRSHLRNKVKDGRRLPSRQDQPLDVENAGSKEKRVRAEGDNERVFRGIRDGPLRRFLRSRVGKAWDLVYAEFCESFRADPVGRTVLDQRIRAGLVQRNVQLIDGLPWKSSPVRAPLIKGEFYVCPESGQLKLYSAQARKQNGRTRRTNG